MGIGRGPGTGRGPHALAWLGTAASFADLHPDGYTFSWAYAVDGSRIAGAATDTFDMPNAGYWTGRSADTWVPLHPLDGFEETTAVGVSGTAFVGHGRGMATSDETHALLWLDDGGTLIDLNPTDGTHASYATVVRGGVQGGSIAYSNNEHAVVWHSTPDSMVDLHGLVEGFWTDSRVTAIDSDGVLYGYVSVGTNAAAVRWTPQPVVCGPADLGSAGGLNGPDGRLDNNDFIAFIGRFFSHEAAADLGVAGGQPGSDGEFNNNDFIAFINHFFTGC
ncbi:MAG: GC-type dockerin domain-anchored protein [Phycisphaerales bacterium]